MDDELVTLLAEHVERYNAGVLSGDFSLLVELFTDDAELAFEGVPAGPLRGQAEIAAAYEQQPPIEELDVIDSSIEDDGTVIEGVAWRSRPGVRAAEMRITPRNGKIARLVVAFL